VSRPSKSSPAQIESGGAGSGTDSATGFPTSPVSTGLRRFLVPAVFLGAALWYVALIGLAALTGNPVTLNRDQLLRSGLVVSGSVDEHGTVSHVNVWKGVAPEGGITVKSFHWSPGSYILPLQSADRESLEITPTRLPGNRPLIYPATESSLEVLRETLKAIGQE